MIQSIPWNSFAYRQTMPWLVEPADSPKTKNFAAHAKRFMKNGAEHNNENSENKGIFQMATVEASTADFLPYYYFGGCAYEILDSVMKKDLRRFVDPTGDIDVQLSAPAIHVTYADGESGHTPPLYLFEEDGRMNHLLDTYTTWIYDHMVTRLTAFSKTPLFTSIFRDAVPFGIEENEEAAGADKTLQIGPLWFVRTIFNPQNVKLQLLVKFEGMAKPDHLLEFVLPVERSVNTIVDISKIRMFSNDISVIRGYPIQSTVNLLQGNLNGLRDRISLRDGPSRHKFLNHVGRIQYLNQLMPFLPDNTNISVLSKWVRVMIFLLKVKAEGTLCKYDYRYDSTKPCDEETATRIIQSMIGVVKHLLMETKNGVRSPKILGFDRIEVGATRIPYKEFLSLFEVSGGSRVTRSHPKRKRRLTRKRR
jgi:hypothetical protein